MSKANKYKAFSLIELSIVILIIGILVAGVTQSSRLIGQMRLVSARSLTLGSPVSSIRDIYLWYDAIMEKSLNETETSEGVQISSWFDLNPQVSSGRIDVVQTDNARKPTYASKGINGLPALYFNGSYFLRTVSNVMPIFGSGSATLIMVFNADFVNGQRFMFMHPISNCAKNAEIGIAVANVTTGNFGVHSGCAIGTVTNGNVVSVNQPTIISILFLRSPLNPGTTANIKIYKNGGAELPLVGSSGSYTSSMGGAYGNSLSPLIIGLRDDANNGGYNSGFVGDIGEIVAFSRSISDEERISVEKYLGKKWGIVVQ
jgi:prepilin-type N-terminal cleavage/methylation domain-containing protein